MQALDYRKFFDTIVNRPYPYISASIYPSEEVELHDQEDSTKCKCNPLILMVNEIPIYKHNLLGVYDLERRKEIETEIENEAKRIEKEILDYDNQ